MWGWAKVFFPSEIPQFSLLKKVGKLVHKLVQYLTIQQYLWFLYKYFSYFDCKYCIKISF